MNDDWNFNTYGLIPTGTTEYRLNSRYNEGAVDTYGFNAGYSLTTKWKLSVGYYYQNRDLNTADGSGVLGRLTYSINEGVTVGVNLSYDRALKSRFSADIKWRFNTAGITQSEKHKQVWE